MCFGKQSKLCYFLFKYLVITYCTLIFFFESVFFSTMILLISHKVDIVKEEAERQRMQREELEVELQKVRLQILTVPPPGKSKSYMEDGMVDLADLSRSL